MSDAEDIKFELDKKCLEGKCATVKVDYEKCLERISKVDPAKEAHCWDWYYRVVSCVDHCADKELWKSLK